MSKRRIAIVLPSFEDTGGVPTVAMFISRAIDRRADYEVAFVSLATSSADPCSVLLRRPSTWLRGIKTRRGTAHGKAFVHVGAMFGELETSRSSARAPLSRLLSDFDLVQVVAGAPSWACAALRHDKPVVLQVATMTAIERRMQARSDRGLLALWRSLMTAIVSRMDNHALRAVDAVMVENPWMQKLASDQARGQVIYAPPGVDIDLFHPAGREEPRVGAPYILSIGRFSDPRKNARLLLEAYGRLVQAMSNAPDLVLAGADGPDEAFWRRAADLGIADRITCKLMLSTEAIAELYRHAECFVLASDEEGFGMVVIEAMASGVPVVSTRSGGPDGIITDGQDGYLVNLDDAEAMADRLGLIVGDPARRDLMGAKARETAVSAYADQLCGNRYLTVYDRLLGVGEA